MNDYIRSSLQVLNANYPGYYFEIEEFGDRMRLCCGHQVRNENDEIDTVLMYHRIKNSDLSFGKIIEEGKRLMNKINQDELKSNVGRYNNFLTNSYLDIRPMAINKYSIAPKEVIFQDEKTTIINWNDHTKTVVKCSKDDTFSPEAGVALCYMKKFITDNDSERFHRILKSLVSVSKFKNSKQEDKEARNMLPIDLGVLYNDLQNIKKAFDRITMEEKHDINTGTPVNSGDNDSDGSSMEVE